jgi:archaemetzincin
MLSCSEKKSVVKEKEEKQAITILIQPFKDIKEETVVKVNEGIKNVYPNV